MPFESGPESTDQKTAAFEQLDDSLLVTLPNGESFDVSGEFKGPNLTSYEGKTAEGEHLHVVFNKDAAGAMEIAQVRVEGEVLFPEQTDDAPEEDIAMAA